MTPALCRGILSTEKNKPTMRQKTFLLTIRETCGAFHQMLVAAATAYDAVQSVAPAKVVRVAHR